MPVPHRQLLSAARWTVRAVGDLAQVPANVRGRAVPATVPGCVHTDLMGAGLIPDPAIGMNEREVQWVSWTDWRYECAFEADAALFEHHEIDLCFECLDTIATIAVNAVEIGKSASEFIPWRFGIQGILKPGRNTLAVTFTSPLRHVHEMAAKLGPRPHNGDEQGWVPFNMIRKGASNFGWDWGPRVATCGITGEAYVQAGRADDATPRVPASPRPRVEFHADPFHFTIDGKPTFIKGANWIPEGLWPRDRTPDRVRQRLRRLLDANMNMIRVWGGGRYEPDWFYDLCDEMGILVWQDFMFACACYPEEEPLRSLIEREARYQVARLSRHPCVVLWCGGNECHWAYESWGFKERLAKSASPKTWGEHYWREMLPRIVAELSPGTPYWPDSPYSPSQRDGAGGWVRAITDAHRPSDINTGSHHRQYVVSDAEVVESHHPNDASESEGTLEPIAVPTHPNPSLREGLQHNSPDAGDRHTWDAWGDGFRAIVPRFCSEFGQQGPSNWRTLERAGLLRGGTTREEQSRDHKGAGGTPAPTVRSGTPEALPHGRVSDGLLPPALAARQLGPGGNARWYDDPMREWFREPRDLDEWHAMAQLLQARSLRIAIEWMRVHRPRCMGALVWQLNDAWPGLSWSLIDSDGRPKLAYEAVKQAFAPRLLTIQPIEGRPHLHLINDWDTPADLRVRLRRIRLEGGVAAEAADIPLHAQPEAVSNALDIESIVGRPADERDEIIVADADSWRATWAYLPEKDLRSPPPALSCALASTPEGQQCYRITSPVMVRDPWIDEDRLPPGLSAGFPWTLRTILPGEDMLLWIQQDQGASSAIPTIDPNSLVRPPMLWTANDWRAT